MPSAGSTLKVSEAQSEYARDIAAFASPKGTLECIGAFGRTDFRGDLAKLKISTLVIHGDSAIVPFEVSGKRTARHQRLACRRIQSSAAGVPRGVRLCMAASGSAARAVALGLLRSAHAVVPDRAGGGTTTWTVAVP